MTDDAYDQFDALPKRIKERVRKLTKRLEDWPAVSGVKALSGNLAGWYRIRTGDYRVRFRVDRNNVIIDKISSTPLIGEATAVIFERGCVEGISAQPQTFAKLASLWYRSMPIRQLCVAVRSSMKNEDWAPLLASPHLLNIRTLELEWGIEPLHVAALADCPHVANLKELELRQSPNLKNAGF
jgi:mRNA-degrading endonuclease RelE of RelBE toxin-antitoxin system